MTVSVGSVSVRVIPDARDWNSDVRRELANTPDQRVRIRPDTSGLNDQVRRQGEDSGGVLAQGMRQGFMRQSPLIAAAIAGAISAGAPTVIAGTTVLFGAIGALAVKSNAQVKAAWTALGTDIKTQAASDAASLVPIYSRMAGQIDTAFQDLSPQIASAFQAVGPLMESFTGSILKAAQVAMPGLVNAVKQAGPVMNGLDTVMVDIGKGLDGFLNAISAHAGAAGTALSSIGSILEAALPAIGTLLGEGAELASAVLPPLATVLHVVGDALQFVAPILPEVAGGLLAILAARGISALLGSLAIGLESVGSRAMVTVASLTGVEAAGAAAGTGFGAAAAGARGLEAAMGPVGWIIAGVSLAVPLLTHLFGDQGDAAAKTSSAVQSYAQALEQAKGAINDTTIAAAAKAAQDAGLLDVARQLGIPLNVVTQAITNQGSALASTRASLQAYVTEHSHWQTVGHAATKVLDDQGKAGQNALNALNRLSGQTVTTQATQRQLALAIQVTNTAAQQNATRLQGIADKASAASGQINLLKTALDALTGKQVSETQAQIAVTQATNNAITSVKGLHGGLVDANGALTVQTEKGAAAQQALIQLAGSDNTLIATMEKHGATTQQVTAKDAQLRDSFIHTAEQMGYTAGQAQALADKIYGIPAQRKVEITADTNPAAAQLNALLKDYQNIKYTGSAIMVNGRVVANATGNILDTAMPRMSSSVAQVVQPGTLRLIGDNPVSSEAFIPINNSARSHAILSETASRMGRAVVPMAAGGIVWDRGTDTFPARFGQSILTAVQRGMDSAVKSFAPVFGGSGGAGAGQWAGIVAQVVRMLGLPSVAIAGILSLIQHESGGNPNAINLTDSNARAGHPSQGLMQTIPATFYRWAGPFASRGITDPLANVYAGTNYALHTYGAGMLEGGGRHTMSGRYIGYDSGGLLDTGYNLTYNGTGAPEVVAPKSTFDQVMSGATAGSMGPVTVYAQFGTETIEARTVRVVNARNAASARNLRSAR